MKAAFIEPELHREEPGVQPPGRIKWGLPPTVHATYFGNGGFVVRPRARPVAPLQPAMSHKALSHAVPRKSRRLVRRARRLLAGAAVPFGEDLHQTRTALKRARALLQLVPGGKRHRDRLGALGRRIGHVRDVGVAVVTFDRVAKSEGLRMTRALQMVRAHLVDRRERLETDPRTARTLAKAERALARRAREMKDARLDQPNWRTIKRRCKSTYRDARRGMVFAYQSGQREADVAFHEWRKAVKRHLYQLKGLALSHEGNAQRVADLDHLGEVLGEAQDLAMFEATLREEFVAFPNPREPQRLYQLLGRRRTQLRDRVRPLAETLFAARPADFVARL
jgi:hypothetical protein